MSAATVTQGPFSRSGRVRTIQSYLTPTAASCASISDKHTPHVAGCASERSKFAGVRSQLPLRKEHSLLNLAFSQPSRQRATARGCSSPSPSATRRSDARMPQVRSPKSSTANTSTAESSRVPCFRPRTSCFAIDWWTWGRPKVRAAPAKHTATRWEALLLLQDLLASESSRGLGPGSSSWRICRQGPSPCSRLAFRKCPASVAVYVHTLLMFDGQCLSSVPGRILEAFQLTGEKHAECRRIARQPATLRSET
eukprot:scaffold1095_cov63-Phaeocystis_antarctica.AAC.4